MAEDGELHAAPLRSISISDSQDGAPDMEDGEVSEDELEAVGLGELGELGAAPTAIFEIKFHRKVAFQQVGHQVISILERELNAGDHDDYKFCLMDGDAGDEPVVVRVFHGNAPAGGGAATRRTDDAVEADAGERLAEDAPTSESPDFSKELTELFMIDTTPVEKMDAVQVPSYKRAVKDVLDEQTTASKKKKQEDESVKCPRSRPNAACFNCGGTDHGLRDCRKPRNNGRINRAKKMFSSKQERYHIDVEQRFAHLRPGEVSDKLRKALDLRRGELPFFFYRMRTMGYPPGWLEDARVEQSGISLIDIENLESKDSERSGDKFDVSRIHNFPGFNCSPGSNYYDDYKYHGVPPMSKNDTKEEFVKSLGVGNIVKGYRRRKLKESPTAPGDCEALQSTEVADMDIDDHEPSLEEDGVVFSAASPTANGPKDKNCTSPTSPKDVAASRLSEERSKSPSLADLEEEQQKLMQELQANVAHISETADCFVDATGTSAENENATQADKQEQEQQQEQQDNTMNIPATPTTPTTPMTPTTPLKANREIIKDTHLGTPVLKFSPFDKLPAGDNFKVGVSDVINFENLPDSTGKYEQMKVVIKRVRNVITQLNTEDND